MYPCLCSHYCFGRITCRNNKFPKSAMFILSVPTERGPGSEHHAWWLLPSFCLLAVFILSVPTEHGPGSECHSWRLLPSFSFSCIHCLCPHNVGQGQNATPDICFHLSVFQLRNKPKEPPKVPKSAPFFLPTVAGLQPQFAVPTDQDPEEVSSRRTHSPFTVDPREEIHCVNCFPPHSVVNK